MLSTAASFNTQLFSLNNFNYVKPLPSILVSGTNLSSTVNGNYTVYTWTGGTGYLTVYGSSFSSFDLNVLCVGSGGCGGYQGGGGGGGGAVIQTTYTVNTPGIISLSVGATTVNQATGNNTTCSGIISITAGGGGSGGGAYGSSLWTTYAGQNGVNGSSGGGCMRDGGYFGITSPATGSSVTINGTTFSGKNGGISGSNGNNGASGGGGAGTVGLNGGGGTQFTEYSGSGGDGVQCSLPGMDTYYYGGGGGGGSNTSNITGFKTGNGGKGGGGGGGKDLNQSQFGQGGTLGRNNGGNGFPLNGGAGGANTGGGGGGGWAGPANGGSGIIVFSILTSQINPILASALNTTSGSNSLSCYICSCDASMNNVACTYGVQGGYYSNIAPSIATNAILYSTNGTTFQQKTLTTTTGTNNTSFTSISSNGTYFLYGCDTNLYLSSTGPNGTLSLKLSASSNLVSAFISNDGQKIFTLSFAGLYKSTNGGTNFTLYDPGYRFGYQSWYKKSLACSDDCSYVMCAGMSNYTGFGNIFYFNMTTNTFSSINSLTIPSWGYPLNVAMSYTGKYQVFCSRSEPNKLYDSSYNLYYHNNYGKVTDFSLILQMKNTNNTTSGTTNISSTTNLDYGPLVAMVTETSTGSCVVALFTTTVRITKDEGITWTIINLPIVKTTLERLNFNNYDLCLTDKYYMVAMGQLFGNQNYLIKGSHEFISNGTPSQYTVNTYTSSGTLTLTQTKTVNYVLVGGGGAGGYGINFDGGGGGGGGLRYGNVSLSAGSYAIIVGAGGTTISQKAFAGGDTSFNGIVALGGGWGGSGNNGNVSNGNPFTATTSQNPKIQSASGYVGSGGGAHHSDTPGKGTIGQGNDGGTATNSTGVNIGGGGGGAGSAGGNASGIIGGSGGNGVRITNAHLPGLFGSVMVCAGGGGGTQSSSTVVAPGVAGCSGDGALNNSINATNGVNNTGGGGGGGSARSDNIINLSGGNGGSGVVLISYLT